MKYDSEQAVSMARASWKLSLRYPFLLTEARVLQTRVFKFSPVELTVHWQLPLQVRWKTVKSKCTEAFVNVSELYFKLRLPSNCQC